MKPFAGLLSVAALVCIVGCGQTDAGISTAVKTKLAANDLVKASEINVDTRDYVVTLTGDVGTAVAKEEAVRVARGTDGVRDVIDHLISARHADRRHQCGWAGDVADNAADNVERGAEATKHGIAKGADSAEHGIEKGADAAGHGIEKGAHATKEGAEKVGHATVDGTKKVVGKVKDAVTDDNRDSDHDGH